ncbi:UNVERIFIED_CONTAM: hypothetical protein GTU68_034571 [Idotea baltica]|nr:hypothetical protein [Idotea baltica]
MVLSKAFG